VTVLVAWTLLPVVLATVGPRLDWPRRSVSDRPGKLWLAWAGAVTRHPAISAAAGLVILGLLLGAARTVTLGNAEADSLAKTGDAHAGLVALERSGIGSGALTPFELLAERTSPATVVARIGTVPGVRGAVAPAGSTWQRDGAAVIDVFPQVDGNSTAGGATLSRVRSAAHALSGMVRVGGPMAANVDFVNGIYGSFPLMIVLIMLFTFVVLVRAFRSILLPIKAVLLNLASVAASWGVLVLIWQDGFGSRALWGIPATGAIPAWVPLMVFAFLFGLSMDYEVFLLARVREEYDATGSTNGAVTMGLGRIGRLITGAALILFLSFSSMATAPTIETKIIGTGLAAGILLDATVVRMLLVPALVVLVGKWNWWLPAPVGRILRVQPAAAVEQHGLAAVAE
jgi:RND superfamily putative drug exporter